VQEKELEEDKGLEKVKVLGKVEGGGKGGVGKRERGKI
jgi:hypothetical protein